MNLDNIVTARDYTEKHYWFTTTGAGVRAKEIKIRFADPLGIKKVIFNPPATIVYWDDGEKTVVHCSKDDTYNKEMGIALCVAKKAFKNSSRKLNDALAFAQEKKENK